MNCLTSKNEKAKLNSDGNCEEPDSEPESKPKSEPKSKEEHENDSPASSGTASSKLDFVVLSFFFI